MTLTLSDNDSTEVSATSNTLEFWQWQLVGGPMGHLDGKDDNVSDDNQTTLLTLTAERRNYSGLSGTDGDGDE